MQQARLAKALYLSRRDVAVRYRPDGAPLQAAE
jgi:hypothetical protein